jgi:threonine dehydrogenase-like Zn-dependent dehydrogenase
MRRLMNVLASGRLDLGVLVTHQYKLDDIVAAYDLFANQRDGVLKVAIKPRVPGAEPVRGKSKSPLCSFTN